MPHKQQVEPEEDSRTEIILHEIGCGGFAESELDEIIEACEKAIKENK